MKTYLASPSGKPIPTNSLTLLASILVNLIMSLQLSQGYNAIMAVVDHMSK